MKKISRILCMTAVCLVCLMPISTTAETVICRGVEAHTSGSMPKVGQEAPDFRAVNAKMEEVSLSAYKGKKVILNIFPSLDTPTCALSVRQFNAKGRE